MNLLDAWKVIIITPYYLIFPGVIINEDWKEKQPEEYRHLLDWAPVRAMFNELHTR